MRGAPLLGTLMVSGLIGYVTTLAPSTGGAQASSPSPTPAGSSDEIVFATVDGAAIGGDTLVLIQGGPVVWLETGACATAGLYPLHPAIIMRDGKQTATLVIVCKAVHPGYIAAPTGTPVNGTEFTTYAAPEQTPTESPTPTPSPTPSPSPTGT